MSLFQRHRWFVAAAGITLAFTVVCLLGHKSLALTALSDLSALAVMLVASAIFFANAISRPSPERRFWLLLAAGFALWTTNTVGWTVVEVFQRREIPDPFFFDIILFFHLLPLIAAFAWRPDLAQKHGSRLALLNFLMLLGWWIFLYAFIVFPHQYVAMNKVIYNLYYDRLYALENAMLLGALAVGIWSASGAWRKVYWNFFAVALLYAINSQFLDRAAADDTYYSGSLYDVPLFGTVSWMAATALSARQWDLNPADFKSDPRLKKIVPQLAMLALLSLPLLGLWTIFRDQSPAASRDFRVVTVLVAMALLGAFVFLKQYIQDQTLIGLLKNSRRGYESQKRLQTQLVQKEKLASLGSLVAGAAQEINHPLTALMSSSDQLWAQQGLTEEQNTLLRKIVNQARRTGDLVAHLLSFAQQTPGEKTLVDLNVLLNRAIQMLEARRASANIRLDVSIEPGLPRVQGNANQLFQAFVEIVENAIDALQEIGGGSLEISLERTGNEAVLKFSDSGPGMREPHRVFDPFYTTKPIGKGTGLGLSAVYGVVQEHNGQITCQNKPEGGALFVVKFPVPAEPQVQSAGAGTD